MARDRTRSTSPPRGFRQANAEVRGPGRRGRSISGSRVACYSLIQKFWPSQQVCDHAAPGPDRILRIARQVGLFAPAVIALPLVEPLLLASIGHDAGKERE